MSYQISHHVTDDLVLLNPSEPYHEFLDSDREFTATDIAKWGIPVYPNALYYFIDYGVLYAQLPGRTSDGLNHCAEWSGPQEPWKQIR